jgi:hypothetical protein
MAVDKAVPLIAVRKQTETEKRQEQDMAFKGIAPSDPLLPPPRPYLLRLYHLPITPSNYDFINGFIY